MAFVFAPRNTMYYHQICCKIIIFVKLNKLDKREWTTLVNLISLYLLSKYVINNICLASTLLKSIHLFTTSHHMSYACEADNVHNSLHLSLNVKHNTKYSVDQGLNVLEVIQNFSSNMSDHDFQIFPGNIWDWMKKIIGFVKNHQFVLLILTVYLTEQLCNILTFALPVDR